MADDTAIYVDEIFDDYQEPAQKPEEMGTLDGQVQHLYNILINEYHVTRYT